MYRSFVALISGLIFFLKIGTAFQTTHQSAKALRFFNSTECLGKEAGKFVKDPYACDKFYYCGPNETAIQVDCPHGMIFNDEKEICDFSTNYSCVSRTEEEEDVHVSQTYISTSTSKGNEEMYSQTTIVTQTRTTIQPTTTTPMTPSTPTIPSLERKCPLKDTESLIFLPHPRDCQRYYICYHGVPVAQECISELHWNPRTTRCDFPEKSGCLAGTLVPTTTTTFYFGILHCPSFRGEQIFPHPEHCNYFIYCINGYAMVQQCPFYHHFDMRTKKCLWQTVATCLVRK